MGDTILYSSSNVGAILTDTRQGPSGAIASPTGTGFVHVTAGAIDGAARAVNLATADVTGLLPLANLAPGTSRQVLVMDPTGTVAEWGAVDLANSSAVSGLLPVANVAPGTNTYVLTTTGGVAVWAAPAAGGITQLTSDVTAGPGSGSVAATVVAAQSGLIAFAAGTGLVTWAAGATGPGLAQASESATQTPTPMVFVPQVSTHSGNQDGSSATFLLSAKASSGVDGLWSVDYGSLGTHYLSVGNVSGYSTVWLNKASPTGLTNASLAEFGGILYVSDTSQVIVGVGTYTTMGFTASQAYMPNGFNLSVGGSSINGGGTNTIGLAKAGTNPSTSISTGGVIYADSSSGAICLYPAGVTAAQLTVGASQINTAAILSVGTNLGVGGTGSFGGGVGVIGLVNATTQPTPASVSGGVALAANAGGLAIYAPSGTVAAMILGNNPTASGGQGVIVLNAAHANPSASLSSQGVIYVDSATGGICLYPASVTGPMLNVNTNSIGFGNVVGGLSAPFQFNYTSIAIGVGGTTTLSAAAALTPKLILSGGTLTSGAILDFSTNAGSFTGAVYFVDCAAINGGAALTTFGISFKNGTTTQSLTALPAGDLVLVTISGTNKITIN